jgi:site-specific recombinase XerD
MSEVAPTLQAFFSERLITQRQASAHTIASYRDTFVLLLRFVETSTGKAPSSLSFADLTAPIVGAFLEHLERERGCAASTRNTRLAAVHSLFRFAAYRHPEHAALIQQVLAIPPKRTDKAVVNFLTTAEIEALLASVDRSSWVGRRDHALIVVAVQTGLRVSELTSLRNRDIHLGAGAHLSCFGKGRKERAIPFIRQTQRVLKVWMAERAGEPSDPLFPGPGGGPLTRDAVRRRLEHYVSTASSLCPSLRTKKLSPHVLRHSCAMQLLENGVDVTVIALWLGHETVRTVQVYLHSDLRLKERALARMAQPSTPPGRYQPPDALMRFLEDL